MCTFIFLCMFFKNEYQTWSRSLYIKTKMIEWKNKLTCLWMYFLYLDLNDSDNDRRKKIWLEKIIHFGKEECIHLIRISVFPSKSICYLGNLKFKIKKELTNNKTKISINTFVCESLDASFSNHSDSVSVLWPMKI